MSKDIPEVGDVWKDRDNEICYIVKVYKNTSITGDNIRLTYRIMEYTNQENINIMECDRDDLIEYLGLGVASLNDLFKMKNDERN